MTGDGGRVTGGGWRVAGDGWRVTGGGWRVAGGGWRVAGWGNPLWLPVMIRGEAAANKNGHRLEAVAVSRQGARCH